MAGGFEQSTSTHPQSSGSGGNHDAAGDFECNICFDLAQDPIVTLCGHLFCWPCLYKWLRLHAQSPECPVCKAVVREENLVPLYGRGKTPTDPRSRSVPGVDIPHRPTGQRPATAPHPERNNFPHHGYGFMGGFPPVATTRLGNFNISAGFGGLFPSLFNFTLHGYPNPAPYGMAAGFPYGFSNAFHGGHAHGFPQRSPAGQRDNSHMTTLFIIVGMIVMFALLLS